jgi:serine protease Do
MKTFPMRKFWTALSILVFASLACQFGSPTVTTPIPSNPNPSTPATPAANQPTTGSSGGIDRRHLLLSTVQVIMEKKQGNEFKPLGWGSGTVISADGLILTNAHVASPASQGHPESEPDRLSIAITQSEDQPPVLSYIAKVLAVDGTLDLAVLQITTTVNGSSVNPADLKLSFVEPGNSDDVHIGDHINIFGFPGVGENTITYTEGSVAGFIAEKPVGDRAWIKTAVTIAHGNSGGLAANDAGKLIGVPTAGQGDCDQADTNGDGQVDTCIPNGNAINFLRPINWATPLIQAAKNNKEYASPYPAAGAATQSGSGSESFSGFSWLDTSNAKDTCKNTGNSVDSYTADALCIWAYFNYSGMTDGEQIREMWYNNKASVGDFTYNWQDGAQGSIGSYLGNAGKPMPAGKYYVDFFAGADLHKIGTASEVVVGSGTSAPTKPSSGTVTLFGTIFDKDTNKPISGAYVVVLTPGMTYSKWQGLSFAKKYIAASQKTGIDGTFEITGVPRNTQFTIVFAAQGYRDAFGDNLQAGATDPDRIDFSYGMSK